jgi:uncharacterized protein YqjF (DUF2071 family)
LGTINAHAPYKVENPAILQVWRNLTFLHWRYDVAELARSIPRGLTLDTFDGSAWVGLVPFTLAGVQPYGIPALPWISEFPETNVRTYVRDADGHAGVWFFTLEADRLAAVLMARVWYHLPYRWAKMHVQRSGSTVDYRSVRSRLFGQGITEIGIEIGAASKATDLDNFLTARFRLYTAVKGRVAYAQIEHEAWPLREAKLTKLKETLMENSGVTRPIGEPLVHYCEELRVKAGALKWI